MDVDLETCKIKYVDLKHTHTRGDRPAVLKMTQTLTLDIPAMHVCVCAILISEQGVTERKMPRSGITDKFQETVPMTS